MRKPTARQVWTGTQRTVCLLMVAVILAVTIYALFTQQFGGDIYLVIFGALVILFAVLGWVCAPYRSSGNTRPFWKRKPED